MEPHLRVQSLKYYHNQVLGEQLCLALATLIAMSPLPHFLCEMSLWILSNRKTNAVIVDTVVGGSTNNRAQIKPSFPKHHFVERQINIQNMYLL